MGKTDTIASESGRRSLVVVFRLLGFDVRVGTGFLIFLGLIVFLYQDTFGLWLAGSLAGFTLLHELGHAVAARSAGANASISLEFLAGYTAFRPDPARPIGRGRRALISVAGPGVQIIASTAVLVALGVNPISVDSVRAGSDAAAAIWWAGPVIGSLNLIPVMPLDGGHLALVGVERWLGDRALRTMAIASIVLTVGGAIVTALVWDTTFVIFIAFLVISQVQLLQSTARRGPGSKPSPAQRALAAEAEAWRHGRSGLLEPGQRLSPWYEADRAVHDGDVGGAMGVVLADLRSTATPRWAPPLAAEPHRLAAIVRTLPAELPEPGNEQSARVLADVLLATGDPQRAGEYAASTFAKFRSPGSAIVVARASAQLGDQLNATRWLDAAIEAADEHGLRDSIERLIAATPDLAALRR